EADRREAGNRARQAGAHRHRRPLDATRGEAPVRPRLIVELQLETEGMGERVGVCTDRRTEADDQSVEVVALEPRVIQGGADRLRGEIDRAALKSAAID